MTEKLNLNQQNGLRLLGEKYVDWVHNKRFIAHLPEEHEQKIEN